MNPKKILSIFMALFLLTVMLLPSFAASTECDCGNAPVIYVRGRSTIVNKAGVLCGTDPEVHELPYTPDDYLEEKAKELIPVFAKAYITNNYTEYNKMLIALFEEVYADYRLDDNGNVTNESGNEHIQQLTGLPDIHKNARDITTGAGANEYCYRYFFRYDIRLDPCAIAEDLHTYVESVKQTTGHSTVKFIARCMGTNILSAYFARYGWEDVEDVILYNPIVGGTIVTNAFFTGDLELDSQSLDFFAKQALEMDDTELLSLILNTIDLANANYGLGITTAMLNPLVKKIAKNVAPDMLKYSYGTTPGYWAMVSYEDYAEAKAFVFNKEGDAEKYAGLIEKLDRYQENVGAHLTEIYEQMGKDGVHIYNISKYGPQCYPITEKADEQSDMIVGLSSQSFGATSAKMGKTLSKSYLKAAKEKGTEKYISPDKVVDASTCMYPDTTWFIKDMEHNCYPWCVDILMAKILNYEGEGIMTVDTDPDYPQYLIYDNNPSTELAEISPMTEENTGSDTEKVSFFKALVQFFRSLIQYLQKLIGQANAA